MAITQGRGMFGTFGVAAPPFTKGPYSWSEQLSFGDPTGYTTAKAISTSTAMSSTNPTWFGVSLSSTATSGWCRAIFGRVSLSGAGGTAEGVRGYVYVNGVAGANARGISGYLDFSSTGSITGLCTASEALLQIPDAAVSVGTCGVLNLAVNTAGTSSSITGTASMIRLSNEGNATGMNTVDGQMYFMNMTGFDVGDSSMWRTNTTTATHGLKILIDGVRYDILMSPNHA